MTPLDIVKARPRAGPDNQIGASSTLILCCIFGVWADGVSPMRFGVFVVGTRRTVALPRLSQLIKARLLAVHEERQHSKRRQIEPDRAR